MGKVGTAQKRKCRNSDEGGLVDLPKFTGSSISGSDAGTSNDSFIYFKPPVDAKPSYLEQEISMLKVLNFIESATYYIRSGFRNNPPSTGCHIHLLPLINATWW